MDYQTMLESIPISCGILGALIGIGCCILLFNNYMETSCKKKEYEYPGATMFCISVLIMCVVFFISGIIVFPVWLFKLRYIIEQLQFTSIGYIFLYLIVGQLIAFIVFIKTRAIARKNKTRVDGNKLFTHMILSVLTWPIILIIISVNILLLVLHGAAKFLGTIIPKIINEFDKMVNSDIDK